MKSYLRGHQIGESLKSWDADKEFQMAGIIASHSILLGGPGFNCLHPLMYNWMINPSKKPMENLPTANDTAANVDLIELISKVRCTIITLEKILMLWCRIQKLVYVYHYIPYVPVDWNISPVKYFTCKIST